MNLYPSFVLWKILFAIFGGFMATMCFKKYKKEKKDIDKQYALSFFVLAIALLLGNLHSKLRSIEIILLISNYLLFAIAIYYLYKAGFFRGNRESS